MQAQLAQHPLTLGVEPAIMPPGAEEERGGGGRLGGGYRLLVTVLWSGGRGSLSSMDMSPRSPPSILSSSNTTIQGLRG